MIKWSSDKVEVTVNKFGVHSQHVIKCFLLHYAVFCLANVNINTLPAYFYGIRRVAEIQIFEKTYLIVIKNETGLKFKMNDSTLFLIGSYAQKLVASY